MEGDAARLMDLFKVDAKDRDDLWHDRLNAAFWPARLGSFTPHVMQNDATGHLCYRLGRDERDGGEAPSEPARLVDWAIETGVGLVFWPSEEPQPRWEFTLGDVLSYRLYGTAFAPRFWNEPVDRGEREVLARSEVIQVGAPNEQMFPSLVRNAVRRFMKEKLGIREPKVLLAQREGHGSRLVFGLNPDSLGGDAATGLAFHKVAWCVPSCIPLYRMDAMVENDAMQPF